MRTRDMRKIDKKQVQAKEASVLPLRGDGKTTDHIKGVPLSAFFQGYLER